MVDQTSPDELFRLYRRYEKLVRRELATPLECDCGDTPVTMFGKDDQLVLNCFGCDTLIVPGLELNRRVEEIVNRMYA
jgi:hypothetical protein